MTQNIAEQTRNAFDFIEKLYFEASYLIKEIEGLLAREDEQFQILKPSGYAVTTRTSVGLEPVNVQQWLTKNLTVFFCPKEESDTKGGQTFTTFHNGLKILYVHIRLMHKAGKEPQIIFGMIQDINPKKNEITKFEKLAFEFAYNTDKILNTQAKIDFEDSNCSFKGNKKIEELFTLKNSDDVAEKVVAPLVEMFRNNGIS